MAHQPISRLKTEKSVRENWMPDDCGNLFYPPAPMTAGLSKSIVPSSGRNEATFFGSLRVLER